MKQTRKRPMTLQGDPVEETLRLYHAWLAVLLQHMGEREIRVSAEEIKNALGTFKCKATKEGDAYVIRLGEMTPAAELTTPKEPMVSQKNTPEKPPLGEVSHGGEA